MNILRNKKLWEKYREIRIFKSESYFIDTNYRKKWNNFLFYFYHILILFN